MKKKVIVLFFGIILGAIFLGGCQREQSKNLTNNSLANTGDKREVKRKVIIITGNDKVSIISKQMQVINKVTDKKILNKNVSIKKTIKVFQNQLNEASKILKTDSQTALQIIYQFGPYIKKYKVLKGKGDLQAEKYKNFVITNLKKRGVDITQEEFDELTKKVDPDQFVNSLYKLQKYILPNGQIVDPQFKKALMEFAKEQGYKDINQAIEDYLILLHDEDAKIKGNCEAIINPIERSECEFWKQHLK